jgi:hypothetical protein
MHSGFLATATVRWTHASWVASTADSSALVDAPKNFTVFNTNTVMSLVLNEVGRQEIVFRGKQNIVIEVIWWL